MDGLTSRQEEEEEGNTRRDNTDATAGVEENTIGDERYDEKARHDVVEQTQLMDTTRTLLCAKGAIMSAAGVCSFVRADSILSQVTPLLAHFHSVYISNFKLRFIKGKRIFMVDESLAGLLDRFIWRAKIQ
jgi:hypothetical protein